MPRGKTSVRKDPTGQRVLLVPGQIPGWNQKGFQVYSRSRSLDRWDSPHSDCLQQQPLDLGGRWFQRKQVICFWLDDVTRQAQILSNFEGSDQLVPSCQAWCAKPNTVYVKTPQQNDGHSCGPFCCAFAEYVVTKYDTIGNQFEIPFDSTSFIKRVAEMRQAILEMNSVRNTCQRFAWFNSFLFFPIIFKVSILVWLKGFKTPGISMFQFEQNVQALEEYPTFQFEQIKSVLVSARFSDQSRGWLSGTPLKLGDFQLSSG